MSGKKKLPKPVKIKKHFLPLAGKMIPFVTIGVLAKMCDRKPITLRKWEEKSWLPPANFHMEATEIGGIERPGARLYTYEFAQKMAEVIKTVKQGETIATDVIQQLHILVKEEKQKFSPSKN